MEMICLVKVKIKVLNGILLTPKGERFKEELLDLVAKDGVLQMEAVTPRGFTGRGAKSYRVSDKTENSRTITNKMPYLPYVNEGTGIYGRGTPIRPIHAKVLHFWVGGIPLAGEEVFTQSVRGQPGQHFVERGANDIAKSVSKLAVIAARRTLE